MTDRLTEAELARMRAEHVPDDEGNCRGCRGFDEYPNVSPCDAARLLANFAPGAVAQRAYVVPKDHRPDSVLARRMQRDGVLYQRFPRHDWEKLFDQEINYSYRCRGCGLLSRHKLVAPRWACLRQYVVVWPPLNHDAHDGIAAGLFGPSTSEELAR
jgi:hypothetical protein